jgi:hypothetical protein
MSLCRGMYGRVTGVMRGLPPAIPTGRPPLLPALPAGASPGLCWAYCPSQPNSRALYGAFADSVGGLTLYRLNRTTG